jgi:hypothetical protein
LGCEQGQGYYFSRPVDNDSASALIETMGAIVGPGPLVLPGRRLRKKK